MIREEKLRGALIVLAIGIPLVLLLLRVFLGPKGGINPFPVKCPKCRAKMPYVRIPVNERQELWGGWTCHKCETEMDKWGKEVAPE